LVLQSFEDFILFHAYWLAGRINAESKTWQYSQGSIIRILSKESHPSKVQLSKIECVNTFALKLRPF
jgi:hypothetical protein